MYSFVPPTAPRRLMSQTQRPWLSSATAPMPPLLVPPAVAPAHAASPPSVPAPVLTRTRPPARPRAPRATVVPRAAVPAAEKENPGSSDRDASEAAGLSFSVGVTIVTGPSPALRHSTIRSLVAQATRPVAIVTCEPPPQTPNAQAQDVGEISVCMADVSMANDAQSRADALIYGVDGAPADSAVAAVGAVTTASRDISESSSQGTVSGDGTSPTVVSENPEATAGASQPAGQQQQAVAKARASISPTVRWFYLSSSDDFSEEASRIATSRDCECIIVDCPTIDSPRELAVKFHRAGSASMRVDSILCVLDGSTLLEAFRTQNATSTDGASPPDAHSSAEGDYNGSRPGSTPRNSAEVPGAASSNGTAPDLTANLGGNGCASPTHSEALDDSQAMRVAMCVENANIIAVTEATDFDRVRQVISALNLGASIVQFDDVSKPLVLSQLVNTNLYNPDTVALNATWRRVLLASRGDDPKIVKALPKAARDVSFVYQARRPFHPTRFYESIKDVATFAGVLRSTGRIWLPTRMQAPLEWEQAGSSATVRAGAPFWAEISEANWEVTEEQRERIKKYWDNQYGDRATELVFVGVGIDKERLQGLLDACLLQDEEMVFNNLWENFSDPFVQWVPLDSEEEEDDHAIDFVEETEFPVVSAMADIADPDDGAGTATDEALYSTETGVVDSAELPSDLLDRASALDILSAGFPEDEEEGAYLVSQPADSGVYDEDDVVVASWDGSVADGILQQMPRVGLPVTIITGFLGSGKTTLLNHILTTDHGLRIAVLVNEFGEVDIDSQLIEKGDWSDSDDVLELANGCICCSINDSFVDAVRKVLDRKDNVEYLIVETTGVADPVPVINSLMVSDIADDVRVDGILTVVDAENFDGHEHMGSEAVLSQILAADTILLSKTDVASPEAVRKTIDYIKEVRPAARILKSQRGRVPISMILDVGLRISDSPAHLNPVKLNESASGHATASDNKHDHEGHHHPHNDERDDHGHSHGHDHSHEQVDGACEPGCTDPTHNHGPAGSNHLEADGFVSASFKSDRALVPELFMERFLQNLPEGVFRAKGLLHFHGYAPRYVFNLSGRRYQFEEDDWPEGIAPSNQLVVIGRNLDMDALRHRLEECHAPSLDTDAVDEGT